MWIDWKRPASRKSLWAKEWQAADVGVLTGVLSALGERADEEERAGGVVEARLAARQRTKLGRVGSTLRVETKRGRGLGSRNSSWLANAIRQCVTHADGDGDADGQGRSGSSIGGDAADGSRSRCGLAHMCGCGLDGWRCQTGVHVASSSIMSAEQRKKRRGRTRRGGRRRAI